MCVCWTGCIHLYTNYNYIRLCCLSSLCRSFHFFFLLNLFFCCMCKLNFSFSLLHICKYFHSLSDLYLLLRLHYLLIVDTRTVQNNNKIVCIFSFSFRALYSIYIINDEENVHQQHEYTTNIHNLNLLIERQINSSPFINNNNSGSKVLGSLRRRRGVSNSLPRDVKIHKMNIRQIPSSQEF